MEKKRRDEVAQVVRSLKTNGHAPEFELPGGELPLPCHQMRYWVFELILSPGIIFPGKVDRCLTGSRGIIRVSGEPRIIKKNGKEKSNDCGFGETSRITTAKKK